MESIPKYLYKVFLSSIIIFGLGGMPSHAQGLVEFGPQQTKIKGSIKYSVIGRYKAHFNDFKGRIEIDERTHVIQSVFLEIKAKTIESNCRWCDRIVRSDQLLATSKYPNIIFKSSEIIKHKEGYVVKGKLEMHGIERTVSFPFQAEMKGNTLDIKGKWVINRKDFKIVWNKFLDQGGVLVGNDVTVDWGIKADIK